MTTKKIIGYSLLGGIIGAAVVVALQSCKTMPKGTVVVKPFDADRYLGKWYEIARYDYRFERNLKNVTAEYSLNQDGSIKVVNRGFDYKKNEWKEATGKATFRGDKNEGKLKVSFFGPFYAGYNVIAIDPAYKYALVAGKSLDYLWILSREKTIPQNIKNDYMQKAAAIGYDTSTLVWVEQDK
ncbi:MAG: lipocalin family protein [Ferruginibacter sp.]